MRASTARSGSSRLPALCWRPCSAGLEIPAGHMPSRPQLAMRSRPHWTSGKRGDPRVVRISHTPMIVQDSMGVRQKLVDYQLVDDGKPMTPTCASRSSSRSPGPGQDGMPRTRRKRSGTWSVPVPRSRYSVICSENETDRFTLFTESFPMFVESPWNRAAQLLAAGMSVAILAAAQDPAKPPKSPARPPEATPPKSPRHSRKRGPTTPNGLTCSRQSSRTNP